MHFALQFVHAISLKRHHSKQNISVINCVINFPFIELLTFRTPSSAEFREFPVILPGKSISLRQASHAVQIKRLSNGLRSQSTSVKTGETGLPSLSGTWKILLFPENYL
eukprot:GFUD01055556.1.p1 GENE.GFUD01055556.1~~GFUD01055556.1.p1  ORF type:complete len:109 (-),score=0.14 GFUD01055556.1:556-882(-)